MSQQSTIFTYPVKLTQDVPAKRFVNYSGAIAGGTVSSAPMFGVSEYDGLKGTVIPVHAQGSVIVEAGGAISGGSTATAFGVTTDTVGRAVAAGTNTAIAYLAPGQSASGAGDFVEIIIF